MVHFSAFRLPGSAVPCTEFSGDISATFARIWDINSPLNSVNFSTSYRWKKFPRPHFFGFRYSHLRLVTSGGLWPQIEPLRSIHFPWYHWFAAKFFPIVYGQDSGNFAFLLHPPTLETSGFFLRQRSPLSTHLWVFYWHCGDLEYITGVVVHFRYYRKTAIIFVWSFWSRPCTSGSN